MSDINLSPPMDCTRCKMDWPVEGVIWSYSICSCMNSGILSYVYGIEANLVMGIIHQLSKCLINSAKLNVLALVGNQTWSWSHGHGKTCTYIACQAVHSPKSLFIDLILGCNFKCTTYTSKHVCIHHLLTTIILSLCKVLLDLCFVWTHIGSINISQAYPKVISSFTGVAAVSSSFIVLAFGLLLLKCLI